MATTHRVRWGRGPSCTERRIKVEIIKEFKLPRAIMPFVTKDAVALAVVDRAVDHPTLEIQ